MHETVINKESILGQSLFSPLTITPQQQSALWNDPDYGLSNKNNFLRWDPFVEGRDPVLKMQLKNEFKMKFGLSYEQIEQCQRNWDLHFSDSVNLFITVLPYSDCSAI